MHVAVLVYSCSILDTTFSTSTDSTVVTYNFRKMIPQGHFPILAEGIAEQGIFSAKSLKNRVSIVSNGAIF